MRWRRRLGVDIDQCGGLGASYLLLFTSVVCGETVRRAQRSGPAPGKLIRYSKIRTDHTREDACARMPVPSRFRPLRIPANR